MRPPHVRRAFALLYLSIVHSVASCIPRGVHASPSCIPRFTYTLYPCSLYTIGSLLLAVTLRVPVPVVYKPWVHSVVFPQFDISENSLT